MNIFKSFKDRIYNLNILDFEQLALDIYRFQAENNPVFKQYHNFLGKTPMDVTKWEQIIYLPIEFFKFHQVKSGDWETEEIFRSSGTTGSVTSAHHIRDLEFYHEISLRNFELFFGPVTDYHILALLPSYLERDDSSLVSMVDHLIKSSDSQLSGFYLNNIDQIPKDLDAAMKSDRKVILWGVSFALLDLAEKYSFDLDRHIIIETGGMKGRRKEMTREDLHRELRHAFNSKSIHSEYGMTELLSQAYSMEEGLFSIPDWMRISIREVNDPFSPVPVGKSGGINVIDLANIHSCSFIETKDIGRVDENGMIEIMGRYDNSDIRGCNLMAN